MNRTRVASERGVCFRVDKFRWVKKIKMTKCNMCLEIGKHLNSIDGRVNVKNHVENIISKKIVKDS